MIMRDHSIFVVNFTERAPYGVWVSHDEKRTDGYGEPEPCKAHYLAPSSEIAEAHWRYWSKFSDANRERTFVSIEKLAGVNVILELS